MIGRKKNIDELMASMKWKVLEASVTTLNWTSSARRPLRIPEAANIPTTGIIDPVMTPMREEKPSLTHPHRVVGRSTTSTSAVCSPAPHVRQLGDDGVVDVDDVGADDHLVLAA